MSTQKHSSENFPSKNEILDFIRESPSPVGKREIARAFRISGNRRIRLKASLKEMLDEGQIGRTASRLLVVTDGLPPVAALEIIGIDSDGEVLARPLSWEESDAPPPIYIAMERRRRTALWPGERILARVRKTKDGAYSARIIRRISAAPDRILGVLEESAGGLRLTPTDRRHKHSYVLRNNERKVGQAGDLALVEVIHNSRRVREARIIELFGPSDKPGAVSLVAIHSHDIPVNFSPEALAQAEQAGATGLSGRHDLRETPLVTIDGADARDFDDAVWAQADKDPKNPGGWHLLVAVADVAHYVHPGDALDRMAYVRGNSIYFPDQVVPMLPEQLSNGWCSLKAGEDRPCLAAHMWIDCTGKLLHHKFERALMRSAARLTYEQVQRAEDGFPDKTTEPLLDPVLKPLYEAYRALKIARAERGTIELDLPDREVVFDADGRLATIRSARRYESHRLIEEYMILANVAAAETLEKHHAPCLYRIHDTPPKNKLDPLREFLRSLNIFLAKGQPLRPHHFNQILQRAAGTAIAEITNLVVLRSQSKAEYNPENHGHFGLALRRYCHFTSPIRRYADLIVHRSLIRALNMGPGGMTAETESKLAEIGEHISLLERRAERAERDAKDRYATLFLRDRVGASFSGQISGVTRFGLFVTLDDTGADGFIPIRTLGWERLIYDEAHHRLIGERSGLTFRLGDRILVRLIEANTTTGSLLFKLIEGGTIEKVSALPSAIGKQRPKRIRGARKKRIIAHRKR